jgi:hypothetical protein
MSGLGNVWVVWSLSECDPEYMGPEVSTWHPKNRISVNAQINEVHLTSSSAVSHKLLKTISCQVYDIPHIMLIPHIIEVHLIISHQIS